MKEFHTGILEISFSAHPSPSPSLRPTRICYTGVGENMTHLISTNVPWVRTFVFLGESDEHEQTSPSPEE